MAQWLEDVDIRIGGGQTVAFPDTPFGRELADVVRVVLAKNVAYGDSALNPVRVFSKADASEAIRVRLDDKLSRIARGADSAVIEDTVLDLIGYLLLLRVAEARAR